MKMYYATLFITFILTNLSNIADKKKYKSLSLFWVIVAGIVLVVFSGFRSGSLGDTGMYMHSYRLLVNNPTLEYIDRDIGFTALNLLLIRFSSDPQILVIAVAVIVTVCTLYVFYKYRSSLELQVYIYITAGYFTVTMNGMRQCLAAALLFLCTPLVIKGDFKKYLLCVLLISNFHQSALFMIPIYFIARMKPWTKEFYGIIAISCIGVIFYDIISPYIFKALENTQYGEYSEFNEGGSTLIRTVVNMVPVILAYLKKEKLKEVWPESDVFVNMALLNCIFVAFGMANWIFNRFTLYLQLYNFILIPYIIKNCFEGKERRLVYVFCLFCYFVFFYREHVIGFNMQFKSVIDLESIFFLK